MCSCHSILECCVMFSGVKLSIRSFVSFIIPWDLKVKATLTTKSTFYRQAWIFRFSAEAF